MTTYVINPITNELESAQPRQTVADKFKLQTFVRDRFALGGGVIQGEKFGDRENFAKPKLKPSAAIRNFLTETYPEIKFNFDDKIPTTIDQLFWF